MITFNEFLEETKKTGCTCWASYKRVPGTKPCSPGSCIKEEVEDITERGEDFIQEGFDILRQQHASQKAKHAEHVFGMVQNAYKSIGGIHGSGFKNKEDMVNNIPVWKVHKEYTGKVRAVGLYKIKDGKSKRVAIATDNTAEGKRGLSHIVKHDLVNQRAYVEVSGPSLNFHKKVHGDLTKYALSHNEVSKRMPDDEIRPAPKNDVEVLRHPELKRHFYQRKIGGEWHTKIALGKI